MCYIVIYMQIFLSNSNINIETESFQPIYTLQNAIIQNTIIVKGVITGAHAYFDTLNVNTLYYVGSGTIGSVGATGPTGAQGIKGNTGASSTVAGPTGAQGPRGQGFVIFATSDSFAGMNAISPTGSNIGEFVMILGGQLYVYSGTGAGSTGPSNYPNSYNYGGDVTNDALLIGPTGPQGSASMVPGPTGPS